jgi:hypothetical protein
MATTDSSPVTTTAACDTNRHTVCRGTILSLTDAHLTECECPCHRPDWWAAA